MAIPFKALRDPRLGLDSVLDFGRHSGYTVSEVLKDRPEYIQWLIVQGKKFYPSVHNEIYKIVADSELFKRRISKEVYYAHADQDDWFDDVPF